MVVRLASILLGICFVSGSLQQGILLASSDTEELSYEFRQQLLEPVRKWAGELTKEKNADGRKFRRVAYSRSPRKIETDTYELTAHVNTAEPIQQTTERFTLTVKKENKKWILADEQVADTVVALYRTSGAACFPFESFQFDREGLTLSATNGSMCAEFLQGEVVQFGVHSADLRHKYEPPSYVQRVGTGHDFLAIHDHVSKRHGAQLNYEPAAFSFRCDVRTCAGLIEEGFTGLALPAVEESKAFTYDPESVDEWARRRVEETIKDRKEDSFRGFRELDREGEATYSVFIPRELKDADDGIWLAYDKWGGWEVKFGVAPKRWDIPEQLAGPIYGYFTEETMANSDPYDLERRESRQTRWFEVHSLNGEVDLATDLPEELHGDVTFGLTLKQDVQNLPFYIISFRERAIGSGGKAKPIAVSSVEVNGEPATWVQTGPVSGRVILPEPMPAGTKLQVRMDWKSNTILKFTHSYSYLPRQGWMPFVRFGDIIDNFELTLRSPAKYDIIGIGHKIDERVEDDIRISHWKAGSPVNFPTIIFGRYRSDRPKFDAKKADGTVIPVTVYVDEASFIQWNIRGKALQPLAEQAANSINLYREMSGLDYPFGELNIVNDPRGFLYGQAPSSLIYLGSGVFRGEGALAPYFLNGTAIAKFLKSVVAHEVGHQWWGNRIANANDRNYWFVESLAEYFSAVYLEAVYGTKAYQEQVDEWRQTILSSNLKGSVQNASTLFSGEGGFSPYQAAVYNKGPYAFHMLRETFKGQGPPGPEGADAKFFAFLKEFSQELGEKREIVTLDIQYAAEKALGGRKPDGTRYNVDLGWFFDQWIRGSGMPQYSFRSNTRQAEDGNWIVEGVIQQRVFLGNSGHLMKDSFYRGIVYVTVEGKGGPYQKRVVIDQPEILVAFKVPVKPQVIKLNEAGAMLARDTVYDRGW